jgi:hypothetical protein
MGAFLVEVADRHKADRAIVPPDALSRATSGTYPGDTRWQGFIDEPRTAEQSTVVGGT